MTSGAPLDRLLSQWRRERPDLDTFCMALCGEIWRAGDRLMIGLRDNLDRHELDFPSLDVLLTLRRNGPENSMSPTDLSADQMLSTSAMTARLDKLESRGLIERKLNKSDRRGILVELTLQGIALTEPLVEGHVAAEQAMLTNLSDAEQKQLLNLLQKVAPID